ncbi:hypothetical protein [Tianweitania sediminis]|uniref:Uncharacterized protein n=1 Tax=Tianweitania sediminis TaxID=1502156 RepID=A0A8J7R259_9HYPH|nr:hypothetical protein [Tianweitania sediminis]MBP0439453.1 hypothetical protein [Tianweitania sediminis]
MRFLRSLFFAAASCLILLAAIIVEPTLALAQTVDPGGSIDLGPTVVATLSWLAPILFAVLMALAVWLLTKVTGWLGLKTNALQRDVVEQGLARAIGYAISKLGDRAAGGIPIYVKSQAIEIAAEYALKAIPGALKHFEKTRDDLADMIEARLDGVLIDPEREATSPAIGVNGVSTASIGP